MPEFDCPVCKFQNPQEAGFCTQCSWTFESRFGINEGIKQAYEEELAHAKEQWAQFESKHQPKTASPELDRDAFETQEEYQQRLNGLWYYAGQIELDSTQFHMETGCFPVQVVSPQDWYQNLLPTAPLLYATLSREQARNLHSNQQQVELWCQLKVLGGVMIKESEVIFKNEHLPLKKVKLASDYPSAIYKRLQLTASGWQAPGQILASAKGYYQINNKELAIAQLRQLEPTQQSQSVLKIAIELACQIGEQVLAKQFMSSLLGSSLNDCLIRAKVHHQDGNVEQAKENISQAEFLAMGGSDWCSTAREWLNLGQPGEAQRCLKKAESMATDSSDWTRVAEKWRDLGQVSEAQRCLKKVESMATGSLDWTFVAREWRDLGQVSEAQRCLKKAESMATGSLEWTFVVGAWRHLGQVSEAQRCLKKAESMITYSSDWTFVAGAWRDLGQPGEAQRCLKKVESMATNSSDWTGVAGAWRDLGQVSEAQRCLKKAESMATNSSDWTGVAGAWLDLGQPGEVQRCLKKAESMATDSSDWTFVAGRG
jgi:tetratricopeptide (TPR) repeat protein